jgi:hypothetical protein
MQVDMQCTHSTNMYTKGALYPLPMHTFSDCLHLSLVSAFGRNLGSLIKVFNSLQENVLVLAM